MRDWALTRWPENTQVDLAKELVRLKAEIKLQREAEEANAGLNGSDVDDTAAYDLRVR